MALNLVLYQPEIPPNTGNISRLSVGIGANLHIVGKPAFDISEKAVRRAGLDHWSKLNLFLHENWSNFYSQVTNKSRVFLITKYGRLLYCENQFLDGDYLVFGSETSGLPPEVHAEVPEHQKLLIPMPNPEVRSLNLSNAAAIVAYEALKQISKW